MFDFILNFATHMIPKYPLYFFAICFQVLVFAMLSKLATDYLFFFDIADGDQPPGAYLLDGNGSAVNGHKGSTLAKSVTAPVLNSVSEVRSPNPETAGYYLDSALDAINAKAEGGSGGAGHIVFTLHVYQYSIDKNGKGGESSIAFSDSIYISVGWQIKCNSIRPERPAHRQKTNYPSFLYPL